MIRSIIGLCTQAPQLILQITFLIPLFFLKFVWMIFIWIVYVLFRKNFRQARYFKEKMRSSNSYTEWLRYANSYDHEKGYDRWKLKKETTLYDYRYISKIEKLLKKYKDTGDHDSLMNLLRANIFRNVGGILNPGLYEYSVAGTKVEITNFQKRTFQSFQEILQSPNIHQKKKIEFFGELRHAYGRTALLLSGGGALGLTHLGVIKSLLKNRLLPRVLSGASAGSMLCALIGTTPRKEVYEVIKISYDHQQS